MSENSGLGSFPKKHAFEHRLLLAFGEVMKEMNTISNKNNEVITVTTSGTKVTGSGSTLSGVKAVTFVAEMGGEIVNGVAMIKFQSLAFSFDQAEFSSIPYNATGGSLQIHYIL